MPYIPESRRKYLDPTPYTPSAMTAGELNFQITKLVARYIAQVTQSYGVINEVVGALECCKLELYRRIAAPYEDTKIEQNGDVY